jgi:hypothetical protein
VLWHPLAAFEVECSLYHALGDRLDNVMHPDQPDHLRADCPFCLRTLTEILDNRFGISRTPSIIPINTLAGTETPRPSHT